jgi:membrane-bound serine protease (ClpP class)
VCLASVALSAGPESAGGVTVLEIEGAIGPATSRYIQHGIDGAQKRGSRLVVLQMDTPGGLDSSMRDIIRAILASPVPVATYVSPSGARAASAGTYILYASHIAAMAPATNLGAATPVDIAGGNPGGDEGDEPASSPNDKPGEKPGEPSEKPGAPVDKKPDEADRGSNNPFRPRRGSAMERKVTNDAVAYIRGLAELRGRNADWAEDAVRNAASLSASDALAKHVADLIAPDLPDLLRQIDGREVTVGNHSVKLATRGLTIERVSPDWRTKLLSVITNPTIAYGLLLIGIYGLMFEGYNPGAVLPGVVGAIALITALFAFQILSVNYAGLALIGLGVGMIIAEFFVPSFGALGLGGLVAFVVGSIILLDSDTPGLNIARPVIGGVATVGAGLMLTLGYVARRNLRRPVATGSEGMIGDTAEALEDFTSKGVVRFGGERWNAITSAPVTKGQPVRIRRVEGLLLWVEPLN